MKQNPGVLIPNKALSCVSGWASCFLCGQRPLQLHRTWGNPAVPKGQDTGSCTGGGWGRLCALAISCATDGWAEKRGRSGSASLSWHRSHLHDTRNSEHKRCVFLWGQGGWLASCPCPRKIEAECWWIGSREVMLRVWPSGIYFGPDLMLKCDIMAAFRLTQLTGMSLRLPLFGDVKHFCCKAVKEGTVSGWNRKGCGRFAKKVPVLFSVQNMVGLKKNWKVSKGIQRLFFRKQKKHLWVRFSKLTALVDTLNRQLDPDESHSRRGTMTCVFLQEKLFVFLLSIKTFKTIIAFGQSIERVWLSEDHPLPQGVKYLAGCQDFRIP